MSKSSQLKLVQALPQFHWENNFKKKVKPYFESNQGVLFDKDCLTILPEIVEESVDTVFADPPFNIGKTYRRNTNDKRPEHEYIEWSKAWIRECVRVLKPGGALFIYNLPKWNVLLGAYLNELKK
ncbi:DNA methylase domain protein [Leptospira kirschneri str. JB]|uniref:DNA methyltransferase n=1 Tax=Leptospira kirschneri TaxID=29507 RepID=UPI0002BE5FED|nr:DNA methyltransferase [Leptospira kirschneri]EMJ96414.1 DNA methylase domain protein [Leptospira kirschneri str. JB]